MESIDSRANPKHPRTALDPAIVTLKRQQILKLRAAWPRSALRISQVSEEAHKTGASGESQRPSPSLPRQGLGRVLAS